jgi:hypothetical protein
VQEAVHAQLVEQDRWVQPLGEQVDVRIGEQEHVGRRSHSREQVLEQVPRRVGVGQGGEPREVALAELLHAREGRELLVTMGIGDVAQKPPEVVVPVQVHVRVHVMVHAVGRCPRPEVTAEHRVLLVDLDLVAALGEP